MATVLRPAIYAPRPPEDALWHGTPRASRILAPLLTSVRFFGAGGQASTRQWRYDSDVGESIWQWQPLRSLALQMLTAVKLFGAGGQAPTKTWRYDSDNISGWQYAPPFNLILAGNLQFPAARGGTYNSPDDGAPWAASFKRNLGLLSAVPPATPLVNAPWKFGYSDDANWQGQPDNSAALLLLTAVKFFGVGGQAPTKQWRYEPDEASGWQPWRVRNLNIALATVGTPAIPSFWKFGLDDAAFWQGQPDASAVLQALTSTKLYGAGGQAPTKQWRYDYLIDEPLWLGRPASSALLAPLLTSVGQVKSRQWLFGQDDAAGWIPALSRNVSLLVAGIPATPLTNPPWKFGYSDDANWQGQPLRAAPIPLLTAVKFFGAGGQAPCHLTRFDHDAGHVPWQMPIWRNVNVLALAPVPPVYSATVTVSYARVSVTIHEV